MLLILEIAMLLGGLWALIKGEVPSFLVGGGKYKVEGNIARIIGILLLLPLPISFAGAMILVLIFGIDGEGYAVIFEIVTVIIISIIALVLVRSVGQKKEYASEVEEIIAKKAQGSLMYAILSATGFAAIICCPLAIVYASQALKLINEHGIGEDYRKKAITSRGIAIVATILWGSIAICIASTLFMGS
ncbi:MAG: hypothetical protein MUP98_21120 [Candidatus Aminicenantes bacterium]|nr:hypothetical protein [Candidatus Aminicenantes bacterium]